MIAAFARSGACAANASLRNNGARRLTANWRSKRSASSEPIASGSNVAALLTSSVSGPTAPLAAGTRAATAE